MPACFYIGIYTSSKSVNRSVTPQNFCSQLSIKTQMLTQKICAGPGSKLKKSFHLLSLNFCIQNNHFGDGFLLKTIRLASFLLETVTRPRTNFWISTCFLMFSCEQKFCGVTDLWQPTRCVDTYDAFSWHPLDAAKLVFVMTCSIIQSGLNLNKTGAHE